ncbi:bacterial transcriptional activator domain-containing protein [Streptomyces sp. NPDC003642]
MRVSSALGDDPQGRPYVPRRSAGDTPYRLSPAIHCDWTHFHSLTEHPLHHAPAGLQDLEQALTLVRGKPFGGRPLPWAEPLAQEMTTRIVDVAHTIAVHRTARSPHHDLSKARRAIACALDIDDTAELLYRDWLRLEAAAANRSGLHTVISRLQHLTHSLNAPLQPETEQLITELLHTTQPHSPTS